MRLSNKFTLSRVVLAPVFFLLYYIPIWTGQFQRLSMCIAIPLLAYMEFTDFLDGYFARKRNEVSDFGKHFDPFADVVAHLSTFVCLMKSFSPEVQGYMPGILFVLLLYREMTMNFVRMVAATKGTAIAARKGGKFKTVFYIFSGFYGVALETMVRFNYIPDCFGILKIVGIGFFVGCVVFSYVSFIDYMIHFGKILKS